MSSILGIFIVIGLCVLIYLVFRFLRFSSNQLPHEEEAFQHISVIHTNRSSNALFFVDTGYIIRWSNDTFKKWFGLDLGSELGMPLHQVIGHQLFQNSLAVFEQVLMGEEKVIEITLDLPSLGLRHLKRIYSPVVNSTGKVIGFTGQIEDQTAIQELQSQLSEVQADFLHLARATSHDIRESIRLIRSFSHLLGQQLQEEFTDEQGEYLGFVQSEAARADQVLKDIYTYASFSAQNLPSKAIPLHIVLQEVLAHMRPEIEELHAEIISDSLPTVEGNFPHLTQLFEQLLSNALTFQPANQAPIIHIGWEKMGEYAQITIRDNGIGIPSEYHDQIFNIFRRLHAQSAYPGSGIGLTICKKIVSRLGGKIWVSPQPQGAAFSFTLPLVRTIAKVDLPKPLL